MKDTDRDSFLELVRKAVEAVGGERISMPQFLQSSGLKRGDIERFFPRWSDALTAAGFTFNSPNERIDPEEILADWGLLVRKLRRIPTRAEYKLEGNFSASLFQRNFGSWVVLPHTFREFAADQSEWADVVALLPDSDPVTTNRRSQITDENPVESPVFLIRRQVRLQDRPTYGKPCG